MGDIIFYSIMCFLGLYALIGISLGIYFLVIDLKEQEQRRIAENKKKYVKLNENINTIYKGVVK